MNLTADDFRAACSDAGVHTVELATPDSQGHLRGKRIPVDRFFNTTMDSGANIADAIFVFDIQNDLPDNEFVNMDTGYLDCTLVPEISSGRILHHRPGYALVLASVTNENGEPHPLAPRNVLAQQIAQLNNQGLNPVVATEMEFYLTTPDWQPVQDHIQYSSLTDRVDLEPVLYAMREALAGADIEVESSNFEYGPGQIEINTGPADAMRTADNTVLFKSIVKQVAVQHDLRATFMPKPWTEASGSGMHVHTSLSRDGENAFSSCDGAPDDLMAHWLGGLMEHALALTFLGAPTSNGPRRIRPYTFAPTHVNWGLDNRTVLARCICEAGSAANRVEYRSAGADAHPHLIIAGILAAGADGIDRSLSPGEISEGDMYTHPGDCTPLPVDLATTLSSFEGSKLSQLLGDTFSRSYASIAAHEVAHAAEHNPDPDAVSDWERQRLMEHS